MSKKNNKSRLNLWQVAGGLIGVIILAFIFIPTADQLAIDGTIYFETSVKEVPINVEVVKNSEERAKGLMYRKEMARDRGMLFIFDRQEIQSFWMKNTYLSLDLIFIDESKKVVGVLANVPPLNEQSRKIDQPSRYVLEANAGWALENQISIGTKINGIEELL